jgi:predicted  nucleic acid-binding Zn-ribbon protein
MREREAERDTLKQAIEKRRGSLERHEKEYTDLQAFAADEKAKADARVAELTALREQILAGRQDLVQKLPVEVLRRYELIRKRRGGVGIVEVKEGICIGCNTSLPPNQNIAVQRAETFEQCPRCQRLLYAVEVVKKIEEARAGGSAASG